jgi:hypothetical protein
MTRLPAPLLATLLLTAACTPTPGDPAVTGAGDDSSAAGAVLACSEPLRDFGIVHEGQVLEHEFEVRVTAPATLDAPHTDCGCTVARMEIEADGQRRPYEPGTALAPGMRLFVGARFDTRGRPGVAQRSVTLTGASATPLALTLLAQVDTYLLAEPRMLAYERILEGQGAERRFQVRSADGRPYSLRPTGRAIPSSVTVQATPVEPDGEGRAARWDVLVRLGGETPVGSHTYPIELESDLAVPGVEGRHFAVEPAWSLQVLGPVALSAPMLDFGLVRADEVVSRSIRLECFEPGCRLEEPRATLEAVSWSGQPEGFPLGETAQVHLRPAADRRSWDLEVTLDGLDPAVAGTFLAQLLVETGHPDLPRLTAVVRGVRAPEPSLRATGGGERP